MPAVSEPAQSAPVEAPRRIARPTPPSSQPVAQPESNPVPPAALPPRLGDVLTQQQQRQLNAAIDQSLVQAQKSLTGVGNRPLSNDQRAAVEQIRNFMQEAEKLRGSNLAAARSLAERAEVLARDLAATLK